MSKSCQTLFLTVKNEGQPRFEKDFQTSYISPSVFYEGNSLSATANLHIGRPDIFLKGSGWWASKTFHARLCSNTPGDVADNSVVIGLGGQIRLVTAFVTPNLSGTDLLWTLLRGHGEFTRDKWTIRRSQTFFPSGCGVTNAAQDSDLKKKKKKERNGSFS